MRAETLAWLGLFTTVGFSLLSVFLWFRARRFRQLTVSFQSVVIQRKVHPELDLLFHGRPVRGLCRSLVTLWNRGTEAIRPSDLPAASFPKLAFSNEFKVFSASVLKSGPRPQGLRVEVHGEQEVRLGFEYINPGEGWVLELVLEAQQPLEASNFKVDAEIIGARAPEVLLFNPESPGEIVWSWFASAFFLLFLVLGFLLAKEESLWLKLIVGVGGFSLLALASRRFWVSYVRARVPKFARPLMLGLVSGSAR